MKQAVVAVVAVVALAALATPARAELIFVATLTGDQEVPPQPNTASGTAVLVLNAEQTALTVSATVFGVDFTGMQTPNDPNDNLTVAHIHAGPNPLAPTQPVVWGFFGSPFNNTMPNEGVLTPFATGVGGTFFGVWNAPEGNNTTLAAQLDNLLSGRAYLNFHTVGAPGGAVRGQILLTPEPATWAVLGLTAVAGGWYVRRRKTGVA